VPESTRPALVFATSIAAPQAQVFETLLGAPQRWLCREASVQREPGGRIRLCWPDGCAEGRFVELSPPATSRFTFRMEGDPLPETMVRVAATPTERDGRPATRVELEHYGFGVGPDWDMLYVGCARAWAGYLKNLRAVMEAGLDLREPDE
jgi:uncharacterized protein YndB with AHSA1/START domain